MFFRFTVFICFVRIIRLLHPRNFSILKQIADFSKMRSCLLRIARKGVIAEADDTFRKDQFTFQFTESVKQV